MSKPLSTAGSVIVTFLTTLILNAGINYWSSDKGAISVGQPLDLDGRTVVVVSIENYTNEFMQGIALELPVSVPLSSVVADSPVKLTEAAPPSPSGFAVSHGGPSCTSPYHSVVHLFAPRCHIRRTAGCELCRIGNSSS